MSIFGSIMSAIFGSDPVQAVPATTTPQASSVSGSDTPPVVTSQTDQPAPSSVDVAAVLTAKAAQAGQTLDWRHSIVDLMKLLNLNSSIEARKELAAELHYTGDTNDSAAMNVWLHGAVMQKLSENGGNVPDDLKS